MYSSTPSHLKAPRLNSVCIFPKVDPYFHHSSTYGLLKDKHVTSCSPAQSQSTLHILYPSSMFSRCYDPNGPDYDRRFQIQLSFTDRSIWRFMLSLSGTHRLSLDFQGKGIVLSGPSSYISIPCGSFPCTHWVLASVRSQISSPFKIMDKNNKAIMERVPELAISCNQINDHP